MDGLERRLSKGAVTQALDDLASSRDLGAEAPVLAALPLVTGTSNVEFAAPDRAEHLHRG
ncbi:hypothetical protein [Saccharothrix sp. NRRL B-16314]|uniref:hypothetical protein n=1 Tax=Saccharothrix sp. NRRL B-16314 TaxID=1463825 RepID=UPI0005274587|nr:hypothetical protein [Saccharothrix sp. NRRL B-16314]